MCCLCYHITSKNHFHTMLNSKPLRKKEKKTQQNTPRPYCACQQHYCKKMDQNNLAVKRGEKAQIYPIQTLVGRKMRFYHTLSLVFTSSLSLRIVFCIPYSTHSFTSLNLKPQSALMIQFYSFDEFKQLMMD